MNQLKLDALNASINKWKGIAYEGKEDHGVDDCLLCNMFNTIDGCKGCPVDDFTNQHCKNVFVRVYSINGCTCSPYTAWAKHHTKVHLFQKWKVLCSTCLSLAEDEIRFLEGLKPIIEAEDSKAIEINPKGAMAWNNRGIDLHTQGKYVEAIQAFDKAIEFNPQYAEAWRNKGNALDIQGKHDQAIQAYDKAIEFNPQDSRAWYKKGVCLKSLGHTAEANLAFDKEKELVRMSAAP